MTITLYKFHASKRPSLVRTLSKTFKDECLNVKNGKDVQQTLDPTMT